MSDCVEIGICGCRIKFCIGNWKVFLPGNWVWYLEKQPNLKKWVKIKKTRPLAPIAAKLASAGTKLFWLEHAQELWDCNRVGQILIRTLFPLTTPLFLPKKCQNGAKSNRIFPEKLGPDRDLILRYSDSPIPKFYPWKYLVFSISASFMG